VNGPCHASKLVKKAEYENKIKNSLEYGMPTGK